MTEQRRMTIRMALAEKMGCYLLDPFTNAEDKEALVEWLANQSNETWADFFLELFNQMDKAKHRVGQRDSIRTLTAPREAITLAAARALGIQEAGEDND